MRKNPYFVITFEKGILQSLNPTCYNDGWNLYKCEIFILTFIWVINFAKNIFLTFWINILQDLQGQHLHFQVLMQFFKRAREAPSRISLGTCCQSWLARYGIASSPNFNKFSIWRDVKVFEIVHVFSQLENIIHNVRWMSI